MNRNTKLESFMERARLAKVWWNFHGEKTNSKYKPAKSGELWWDFCSLTLTRPSIIDLILFYFLFLFTSFWNHIYNFKQHLKQNHHDRQNWTIIQTYLNPISKARRRPCRFARVSSITHMEAVPHDSKVPSPCHSRGGRYRTQHLFLIHKASKFRQSVKPN